MKQFPIKIVNLQDEKILEIRWAPNNVCNFRCRYCFPGSNAGDHKSPSDLSLVIANFKHLIEQYKTKLGKNKIHLKINGGEPTLWKDLAEFIQEIKKDNDVYVSIITNGSRTLRWWKENGHLLDNIHLSHHVGQADIDHTIAVADTLYELGRRVTVKVLMDPISWYESANAVEYLKAQSKHKWFIVVGEVIEPEQSQIANIRVINNNDIKYNEIQKSYLKWGIKRFASLKWFWKNRKLFFNGDMRYHESKATLNNGSTVKATMYTYINKNWHSFKGWECNIGIESIFINWDGRIEGSCGEALYGVDYYHNILDQDFVEKFNPDFVPVVCSKYNCTCCSENHLSKRLLG